MKRDMDFVRHILLDIEKGQLVFETLTVESARVLGVDPDGKLSREASDKLRRHLELMDNEGLVEIDSEFSTSDIYVKGLTWKGHDFVDSMRDSKVWAMAKMGVSEAKGFTFDLVIDLAKGYLKKTIKDKTGIDL